MIFLILIIIFLSITGYYFYAKLTQFSNPALAFPAGLTLAIASYIWLLNFSYQFFHQLNPIIFSTLILIILSGWIITKTKFLTQVKNNFNLKSFSLSLLVIGLVFTKMATTVPASDATIQWSLAGSFAKGNYPMLSPAQPNFTARYHLGVYLFEGALKRLTNLPLIFSRVFINTIFLSVSILMLLFWLKSTHPRQPVWVTFIIIITFVGFGIIIIGLPLPSTLTSPDLLFNHLAAKSDQGGAGMVDLNSLSYLPSRSFSLSLLILTLIITLTSNFRPKTKFGLQILLLLSLALIEESAFLATIFSLFIIVTFGLISNQPWKFKALALLLITPLLSLLQGGFVKDALASSKSSGFIITWPWAGPQFSDKLFRLASTEIIDHSLMVVSPLILLLLTFVWLYRHPRSPLILLTSTFAIACFLIYLLIEYVYTPSSNIRFYNYGYLASGLAFCLVVLDILTTIRPNYQRWLLAGLTLLLFIPTVSSELLTNYHSITQSINSKTPQAMLNPKLGNSNPEIIAHWAYLYLPINSRLLLIDGESPAPSRQFTFEYEGLYTWYSSSQIRTVRQEPGPEYFDAIQTLNPTLLKQLGVTHLYVETNNPTYQNLSFEAKLAIANPQYFKPLISLPANPTTDKFTLYQILPAFFSLSLPINGTLDQLQQLIPPGKTISISDTPPLSTWYRMASSMALRQNPLGLSQRDHTDKTIPPNSGYMAVETTFQAIPDSAVHNFDYYLLPTQSQPSFPAELIWQNSYASAWKRL